MIIKKNLIVANTSIYLIDAAALEFILQLCPKSRVVQALQQGSDVEVFIKDKS
jgi:hypothetical protein